MRNLCCSFGVVALVALAAVHAGAQPAASPSPQPPGYERAFVEGRALFEVGRWAEARAKFLEAYRIHQEPLLAFNIGSTYRSEGKVELALRYYRKFLELAAPDDEYRGLARSVIAELEASMPEPAPEPEPNAMASPRDVPRRELAPGRGLRIGGVVTMIAGGVLLGVSVERGLHARSVEADLEQSGGEWTPERERALADGDRARTHSITAGVIGLAAVGTGAALYYFGGRGEQPQRAAVSVTASPDRVGFAVAGRF